MHDEQLERIAAALAGDRDATSWLVARLLPVVQAEIAHLLMRVAPAQGRSKRQDLDDLVQDVFAAFWDRDGELLLRWDPQRGRSLASYARLVARSRALDVLRSRPRGPWLNGTPTEPDTMAELAGSDDADHAARVAARETLLALQAKLRNRLSSRDQFLFFALFVEERPPTEVAAEAGMSADAVYQFSSRLRRKVLPSLVQEVENGAINGKVVKQGGSEHVGASKP